MSSLLSLLQVLLFTAFLFQCATTFPSVGRPVEEDSFSDRRCLCPRDHAGEDFSSEDDTGSRRLELQTRQLGDLEFANRYSELLKSQAKLASLCSFLRRMQNNKSGLSGNSERVKNLMNQYMCASVYQ